MSCPVPIISAGTPTNDGCPVLTKTRVFLVDQGVQATLEHVIRDTSGNPVDLGDCAEGESESDADGLSVVLRIAPIEVYGATCSESPREIAGMVHDAPQGVVRAQLSAAAVAKAGIYQLAWGVFNEDEQLLRVSRALLSVERTLFAPDNELYKGPPTIGEIRLSIRDNHASDNLLLDDVEFDSAEIVQAIVRPVQYWNEQPPPVAYFNVNTFPFREMWLRAIQSILFRTAADHYRRNRLAYQAGGVTVDDQNKEREYLLAAKDLQTQWETFVTHQKVAINVRRGFSRFDTHDLW